MLKSVKFGAHAFDRLIQRSCQYGLSWREARDRVFETIKTGKKSKRKHKSRIRGRTTYYRYFNDNLSFYVICKENIGVNKKYLIKTVIIEQGR